MEKRDSIRYWSGAIGAAALAVVALVVIVSMQTPAPKSQKGPQTQAAVKPAAVKPQAAMTRTTVKPPATVKPQAAAMSPATPKPKPAGRPLTEAERKVSEQLWVEQKKLETDSGRVKAATPDGRHRIAETIAKQFGVPEKLVDDLRARKVGYGEITAALALSQQLMKRDKVTRQQALDSILAARKSGQGWGAIAAGHGLKLGDVVTDVMKADKQLAKLAVVKAAG